MRIFRTILILSISFFGPSNNIASHQLDKSVKQLQESSKPITGRETRCDFSAYKSITLDPDTIEWSARKKVDPVYPPEARQRGIQGFVIVKVLINTNGDVERACAVNGNELLRPAAEAAALQWKFGDMLSNVQSGKPVSLEPGIPIYFILSKEETQNSLVKLLKEFGKIDFSKAEFGSLSEMRVKHRVFIYTENPLARERIYLVLQQYTGLEIVDKPDQADYFVGYGTWKRRFEDFVSPAPIDPSLANDPVITEELLIFIVSREPKSKKMRPRILLWGNKRGEKYPGSVKFDQTPRLLTLSALDEAISQIYRKR